MANDLSARKLMIVSLFLLAGLGVDAILATDQMKPAWLGLGLKLQRPEGSREDTAATLYVRFVVKGGPADRAHLAPQDLITGINGKLVRFKSSEEALDSFARLRPGQVLLLTVRRGVATHLVKVVAVEMPDEFYERWKQNREVASLLDAQGSYLRGTPSPTGRR